MMRRSVYFVSDRTGITVDLLGRSLLTQFPDFNFVYHKYPFVETDEKIHTIAERIREAGIHDGAPALVFCSLVDPSMRDILVETGAHVIELYSTYSDILEHALGRPYARTKGRTHGMGDEHVYQRRMDAVNFTLNHDDGIKTSDLGRADLVLIGVSRCGKTPTCLYLAMQYHLRAANYPLTEEDLDKAYLPASLEPYRDQLYGLSISPERLSSIRQQRRSESRYASLEQCRYEVAKAEALYRRERIPYLQTTAVSVEEIATLIVHERGLASTKQLP